MKHILLLWLLLPVLMLTGCEKGDDGAASSSTTPVVPTPPDQPDQPDQPVQPDIEEGSLPVIFHVLYEDPNDLEQNIRGATIRERMKHLNWFYAADLFNNAAMGIDASVAVNVKFVLATHDPEGNKLDEAGIDRVYYAGSADMDPDHFIDPRRRLEATDRAILWPPDRYINIWIYGFRSDPQSNSEATGVAYLPFCTPERTLPLLSVWGPEYDEIPEIPSYMHGISLNSRYFDLDPKGLPDEGLFTICHEMGHYLGLLHAFEEGPEAADPDPADHATDDGCRDTPKYNRSLYEEWLAAFSPKNSEEAFEAWYRDGCGGGRYLSVNVMDYYYGYRTNLTVHQKNRIEYVMKYSPWIPRSVRKSVSRVPGAPAGNYPEPVAVY